MNCENQNIEYKQSWRDEYLKWICGFANAHGGKLYIGIDDDGKIVGIQDAHKLSEEIPNKIASTMGIVVDVNILKKENKDYIEIIIPESYMPISLRGVYHYRSGSTKQELNGIALQQFVLKKFGLSWDDTICNGAGIDDIDNEAINYFIQKSCKSKKTFRRISCYFKKTNSDKLKSYYIKRRNQKCRNNSLWKKSFAIYYRSRICNWKIWRI